MAKIKIGDPVHSLDHLHTGTVTGIKTYVGMDEKLVVELNPPHYGELQACGKLPEENMEINVALACKGGTAIIVFSEDCYWEIPTGSEAEAMAIAASANSLAGKSIDSIIASNGRIAIKTAEVKNA
jgi:hypothetical protein